MPAETQSPRWIIEPLGKHHDRTSFSCSNSVLDHYLKELAGQDARRHVAAPFILVSNAAARTVLGYYTLSSFAIDLSDLPHDVARRLPTYPRVPVTLLGRLAVDQRHTRQGLGELLLMDALHRAFTQSSQIAAVAVVVDAIDANAIGFYQHFKFIPFPDRRNRLFLPMQTIAALFSAPTP